MEYAYDKSANRLIVHVDGSTTPQERLPIWKRAFEISGWKPGGTICGIARANTIVADLESLNELIKLASKHKVKKAAFTIKEKDSLTMSQEGLKLISHYNIPTKLFTDLQEMFDWINE